MEENKKSYDQIYQGKVVTVLLPGINMVGIWKKIQDGELLFSPFLDYNGDGTAYVNTKTPASLGVGCLENPGRVIIPHEDAKYLEERVNKINKELEKSLREKRRVGGFGEGRGSK